MIELEPGEEIKPVESAQPSDQFQDYTKLMMMVALKSLGLCYSMFDEKHTNFYGSRGALNQYVELCKPRRASNQALLENLTRWRLAKEILECRLKLPDGMTVNDLPIEWTPAGIPWWKPDEEAKGFTTVVLGGFDSPSGVCQTLGKDFKDIVDQRARDEEYARSKKVSFSWMSENIGAINVGT